MGGMAQGHTHPWPQAERHIKDNMPKSWESVEKKVCGAVPEKYHFSEGSSACFQISLQGPFYTYYPSLGYPINLLIGLFFKDQHIREGMTLPTIGSPKRRTNILKPTCNYYVSIAAERNSGVICAPSASVHVLLPPNCVLLSCELTTYFLRSRKSILQGFA